MQTHKRRIVLFLIICLLLACFSTVAFGADSKLAEGGFYMKSADTGVTVKLQNANSAEIKYKDVPTVKIADNKYARVFEGAVKLTLTIGTEENAEYLVIMYAGDGDVPTVENTITYINQYHSGDTFIVYPSDMTSQTELKILITSDAEGFTNKYVKLGYMPAGTSVCAFNIGDVIETGGKGVINILDINSVVKHIVKISVITEGTDAFKAADTDLNQKVNILDINAMVRIIIGADTFFTVK